jgi:Sulfatase-modifying factor enzyme 1
MTMVYVPGGAFQMGSAESDALANFDEKPPHPVTLDAFWIDKTEVTNAQYKKCVQAGACKPSEFPDDWDTNGDPQPVVGVSWYDAGAYCQWAGATLPTEAQWEKAARGMDGRIYPWGNETATCEYAVMAEGGQEGCGRKPAWPVGSKPKGASPYGALDMAGNVWEWVADWYAADYYGGSPGSNPPGPDAGDERLMRGGGWETHGDELRAAYRYSGAPDSGEDEVGFRCAVSASALAAPVAAVTTPTEAATPTAKLPARVLFIGDSDSWYLDTYLPRLAASGTPPIAVESKVIQSGRAPLALHWDRGKATEEIRTGKWDIVVLQEDLDINWKYVGQFYEYSRKFHNEIEQVGAETVLYMPWDDIVMPPPPTMQDVADAYTKAGAELGVRVAPLGLAFERATREQPGLNLHLSDGLHANLPGIYLTLCVLYATMFDRSPVGLTYRMEDVAKTSLEYTWWNLDVEKDWQLTEDDTTFLQRIAWETVQEYQAQHPVK